MGILRRVLFATVPWAAASLASTASAAAPPPPAPGTHTPRPAYATPEITKLSPDLKIQAGADSFEKLVAAVKPDFSWDDCYLLWIRDGATDHPSFELSRAWLYEPAGGKAQCVLLHSAKDLSAVLETQFGGEASGCFFPLTAGPGPFWQRTSRACGTGDFLHVIATSPEFGTVYEINWESEPDPHAFTEEMPLFLRKDPAGKWHFLGMGPIPGTASLAVQDVVAVQVAANKSSPAGVSIQFTLTHTETDSANNHPAPGSQLLPDLQEYQDAFLDGISPELHFSAHSYLLPALGDTLEKMLKRRIAWEFLWHEDTPEIHAKIETTWRTELQKLNPTLANKPAEPLAPGTKVFLPDTDMMRALVEAFRHPKAN